MAETNDSTRVCRGSIRLGSACMTCTRCQAELVRIKGELVKTLEMVLMWITNPNTHEDSDVISAIFRALQNAGYDDKHLDGFAIEFLKAMSHSTLRQPTGD